MGKCGVVDTVFFGIFFSLFLAVIGCLTYTWVVGDTRLLLYNIDSNGNLCGTKISDRLDFTDKPLLFLFDSFQFPHLSYSICTDACPRYDLKTNFELYSYANSTNHLLCDYNTTVPKYLVAKYNRLGNCPMLPILKSVDYLQICIPEVAINSAQILAYIDLVVPLLNQCFRSIFNYWAFIAIGVISAFFLGSLLFIMLRCLSKCVLAAVFPIITVTIACGLGSLWFAYHVVCKRLSQISASKLPLTSFEVYNEICLFIMAVVIAVILVALLVILFLNITTFPHELDILFRVFAKFMDSSKIIIWLPAIGCVGVSTIITGGAAAAFCALGLVEVLPSDVIVPKQFYQLPGPPFQARPERPIVGVAVVLALFWLPRLIVNSIKLSVHLAASEYLQISHKLVQSSALGIKPSWFSLLSTAFTVSLAECIFAPISFFCGFLLSLLNPCESCIHWFNDILRAVTYWLTVGQATQASVHEFEVAHHKNFYDAVSVGLANISMAPRDRRRSAALVASDWFLLSSTVAVISLPVCVVIFQMRYAEFLSLSTPSLFLVSFFGYWIATASLAPFSAAFTTFCLNYEKCVHILNEKTSVNQYAIRQNEINLYKQEEKL